MTVSSVMNEVRVLEIPYSAVVSANAVEFRALIENEICEGAQIVLDFTQCEFIDSAGLGAIFWSVRRLAELGGDLCICGARKPVQALFELVRMNKLVSVFKGRQEALNSLGA